MYGEVPPSDIQVGVGIVVRNHFGRFMIAKPKVAAIKGACSQDIKIIVAMIDLYALFAVTRDVHEFLQKRTSTCCPKLNSATFPSIRVSQIKI